MWRTREAVYFGSGARGHWEASGIISGVMRWLQHSQSERRYLCAGCRPSGWSPAKRCRMRDLTKETAAGPPPMSRRPSAATTCGNAALRVDVAERVRSRDKGVQHTKPRTSTHGSTRHHVRVVAYLREDDGVWARQQAVLGVEPSQVVVVAWDNARAFDATAPVTSLICT